MVHVHCCTQDVRPGPDHGAHSGPDTATPHRHADQVKGTAHRCTFRAHYAGQLAYVICRHGRVGVSTGCVQRKPCARACESWLVRTPRTAQPAQRERERERERLHTPRCWPLGGDDVLFFLLGLSPTWCLNRLQHLHTFIIIMCIFLGRHYRYALNVEPTNKTQLPKNIKPHSCAVALLVCPPGK